MPLNEIELIKVCAEQLPLVNKFYKRCRYPSKTDRNDFTFIIKHQHHIIAALRVQLKQDDLQSKWLFLRAMVVAPEFRGMGVGSQCLEQLTPILNQSNSYCYADKTLIPFYQQAGFEQVEIELANIPYFIKRAYLRYLQSNAHLCLLIRTPASEI